MSLIVLSFGCSSGGDTTIIGQAQEAAPLVVAAGAEAIAREPVDDVSATLDLTHLGVAGVDEVYKVTTPPGEPFVFDLISRSDSNMGAVRVSVGHASDGGQTPSGGPESLAGAGLVVNATGTSQRGDWLESNGDGFARCTLRGEITSDQVIACQVETADKATTALVCIHIGPRSSVNVAASFSGDHPGVVEEETLYSSDSFQFGLPTIAVSGDRTSIVVYEGDRADQWAPVRYELRMQYDHATKAVTGGASTETNTDWGNWRDHDVAALFNVLARVHSGTEKVTLALSFDRGATFGQTVDLGAGQLSAARLATIAMAADYTLATCFWRAGPGGTTELVLVEGRPSAFDGGGSPTGYAFDPPRIIRRVAGDATPAIFSAAYSEGGDLVIGYGYSAMVRNEFGGVTVTTAFRCAVRLFGETDFFDSLVEQDVIVGKDPSVALSGQGSNLRIFYAYEGRVGVLLRESKDAGRTWSGAIQVGERFGHMPTVVARGEMVDVFYLEFFEQGLELHVQHWDQFGVSTPQVYRLTEAKMEPSTQPLAGIVAPPGGIPKITEVAWFGYDVVRDGDDIIVVYDEVTYEPVFIALPAGAPALGMPGAVSLEDQSFVPADPPPLAPGLTEPLPAPNPDHAHQLKLKRIR